MSSSYSPIGNLISNLNLRKRQKVVHSTRAERANGLPPIREAWPAPPGNCTALNKKKIVWKDSETYSGHWTDSPRTNPNASSSPDSSSSLETLVRKALPVKDVASSTVKKFISVAKESLFSISSGGGVSLVPIAGGAYSSAKGVDEVLQAANLNERAKTTAIAASATTLPLEHCSHSIARYLRQQAEDRAELAALHASAAVANIATSATGVGALAAPIIGATSTATEQYLKVRTLWARFKAMEVANNFLAQAALDPTHYHNAMEVCPELAAYVLATCETEDLGRVGENCPLVGQMAEIQKIAREVLTESPLHIITGEPAVSKLFSEGRPAQVGGDLAGALVTSQVGSPRTATQRAGIFGAPSRIAPAPAVPPSLIGAPGSPLANTQLSRAAWPPNGASSNASSSSSNQAYTSTPVMPFRSFEAWGPQPDNGSSASSSPSSQAYETTEVRPYSRSASQANAERPVSGK